MSESKPVYRLANGELLTKSQFISYFENKVFKTIRTQNMLEFDDIVVVAVSGGKDSITTLYLLNKYMKRKNLHKNLKILAIDEGIADYRDKTLDFLKEFAEKLGIELHIRSYKELFGSSQDENVKELLKQKSNISPCNICGTYRRQSLNKGARDLGATKLATGHNLDDEAQNILLNVFKNNFKVLSRLGPVNGVVRNELFVPRIKPLYFCTEKEVRLYTLLKGFDMGYDECPYARNSFRQHIGEMLNKMEDEHKGIKHSVINFYLEMQGALKNQYLEEYGSTVTFCSICGEPSEKQVCNTCELKKKIKT